MRTPAANSSYELCTVDYNGNIKAMEAYWKGQNNI
ncbi:MAG: hypothetical protein ACOCRZ_03105 [Halothermotrichaceae bacterium]